MSVDLRERLHQTARIPTQPVDLSAVRQGIRRRQMRRGVGASVIGAVGIVAIFAVLRPAPVSTPEIGDPVGPPTSQPQGTGEPTSSGARVEDLESERARLLAAASSVTAQLREVELGIFAALQDDSERGAAMLRELELRHGQLQEELDRLQRQLFAVEAQLVELGRLDDPVAVARSRATASDRDIADRFVRFATNPEGIAKDGPSFASTVALGLGSEILREISGAEVREPSRWILDVEHFRGAVGPFSALDLVRDDGPTQVLAGEHPHCASPPVPVPTPLEGYRQVAIVPTDLTSCLDWWTVDLFIDPEGQIVGVTSDLWEP